jgi:hypothetical protein
VLSKEDNSHPRDWSQWKKLSNIAVIASMASRSTVHTVVLEYKISIHREPRSEEEMNSLSVLTVVTL